MLGGLGAYIGAQISGAIRRSSTIYGLYALAGFLIVCSAGYLLNALHTFLMLRYGGVAASLWVAGGLFVTALIAVGVAAYIKNRPEPKRNLAATAMLAAPLVTRFGSHAMRSNAVRSGKGWKAVALVGVIGAGVLLGRQLFGSSDDGDEPDDI